MRQGAIQVRRDGDGIIHDEPVLTSQGDSRTVEGPV